LRLKTAVSGSSRRSAGREFHTDVTTVLLLLLIFIWQFTVSRVIPSYRSTKSELFEQETYSYHPANSVQALVRTVLPASCNVVSDYQSSLSILRLLPILLNTTCFGHVYWVRFKWFSLSWYRDVCAGDNRI